MNVGENLMNGSCKEKSPAFARLLVWLRQESNLDLELRKLSYYPLYYEAGELFMPAVRPL